MQNLHASTPMVKLIVSISEPVAPAESAMSVKAVMTSLKSSNVDVSSHTESSSKSELKKYSKVYFVQLSKLTRNQHQLEQ